MLDKPNAFDEFFSASKKPVTVSSSTSLEEFFGKPVNISQQTTLALESDESDALDFFGPATTQRMLEQRAMIEKIYAPYKAVLEDYIHKAEEGKWSFFGNDPNQGYKFHLNVKPENVRKVAAVLKLGGYHHKYLSGGEVENGKIFTVYTGSKQQTEQIVQAIADGEVAGLLEKPLADDSNEALLSDYGDYYGGGISYYEPQK